MGTWAVGGRASAGFGVGLDVPGGLFHPEPFSDCVSGAGAAPAPLEHPRSSGLVPAESAAAQPMEPLALEQRETARKSPALKKSCKNTSDAVGILNGWPGEGVIVAELEMMYNSIAHSSQSGSIICFLCCPKTDSVQQRGSFVHWE